MKQNNELPILLSLKNQFLIATPAMPDPFFKKSVIYLCEHNNEGALGLVINHPIRCPLGFIFDQMEIKIKVPDLSDVKLMIGGPVHQEHGFVMHRDTGEKWRSTLKMPHGLCVTTSQDILKAIAIGEGPKEIIFVLGYSDWDSGQIEKELVQDNAWLTYQPNDSSLLFDVPCEERWEVAMKLIGVNVSQFSMSVGHA
jgi:putative transcriptional regulator